MSTPWCLCSNFTLVLSEACMQCPVWLFSSVPWCRTFQVCWSDFFCMALRWLRILLLLLLLLPTFLTSHQFSWFAKECRSLWPKTSYSLFCQKYSDYIVRSVVFCVRTHESGRRLSILKLSYHLFGIMVLMESHRTFSVAKYLLASLHL